jgi:hypothetical protein
VTDALLLVDLLNDSEHDDGRFVVKPRYSAFDRRRRS